MSKSVKKIVEPNSRAAYILASVAVLSAIAPSLAFAQKKQPPGIETADVNVHENRGPVSKQDIVFHEGLCQAGITTEALESLGGCSILSAPGQSDEVRQDQ